MYPDSVMYASADILDKLIWGVIFLMESFTRVIHSIHSQLILLMWHFHKASQITWKPLSASEMILIRNDFNDQNKCNISCLIFIDIFLTLNNIII
jgi:hypothetical protein